MNKAGYILIAVGLLAIGAIVLGEDERFLWIGLGGLALFLPGFLLQVISAARRVQSGALKLRPQLAIRRFAILLPICAVILFLGDRLLPAERDSLTELLLKSVLFATIFAFSQTAYQRDRA